MNLGKAISIVVEGYTSRNAVFTASGIAVNR